VEDVLLGVTQAVDQLEDVWDGDEVSGGVKHHASVGEVWRVLNLDFCCKEKRGRLGIPDSNLKQSFHSVPSTKVSVRDDVDDNVARLLLLDCQGVRFRVGRQFNAVSIDRYPHHHRLARLRSGALAGKM